MAEEVIVTELDAEKLRDVLCPEVVFTSTEIANILRGVDQYLEANPGLGVEVLLRWDAAMGKLGLPGVLPRIAARL